MLKKFLLAAALSVASIFAFAQPYYPNPGFSVGSSIAAQCATASAVLYNASAPCSANLTWAAATGQGLAMIAGTATTDVNALSATQTWNNAAVAFTAAKIVITDTASAAGSLAMQILGGAAGTTNLMSLSKVGLLAIAETSSNLLPGIAGVSNPTLSGINFAGGVYRYVYNSQVKEYRVDGDWRFASDVNLVWGSITSLDGAYSLDTNTSRISAGLIGVGTGTAGSFAGRIKLTSTINAGTTIANLNAAPTAGEISTITNQTVACPAKGVAPTAGGAFVCPVFYNGAAWVGL